MTDTPIHLTGAVAQPGDIVLITIPHHYDDQSTQALADMLHEIAPGTITFALIKGDIKITVTRPNPRIHPRAEPLELDYDGRVEVMWNGVPSAWVRVSARYDRYTPADFKDIADLRAFCAWVLNSTESAGAR